MKYKYIFFDLDATLLPMNQDAFLKAYFDSLIEFMFKKGYEPIKLRKSIWGSIMRAISNNGSKTNENAFWDEFCACYGKDMRDSEQYFVEYYKNHFDIAKSACGFNPEAAETIKFAKEQGFKVVLATNPVFPRIATEKRIVWAGIDKNDFEYVSTYENSSFCKPNPKYYEEILTKLDLNARECLMVGNDATEDMVAQDIGMDVFLLTDCLINTNNVDIEKYHKGSFKKLKEYIKSR